LPSLRRRNEIFHVPYAARCGSGIGRRRDGGASDRAGAGQAAGLDQRRQGLQPALQKIGDQFSKKSGISVAVEHPEDAPGKFQQAAAAGKGPDIWCWPHDRMGEWAQSGLIVPINPGKKVHDAIEDTAWNAFKFQARPGVIRFPWRRSDWSTTRGW